MTTNAAMPITIKNPVRKNTVKIKQTKNRVFVLKFPSTMKSIKYWLYILN